MMKTDIMIIRSFRAACFGLLAVGAAMFASCEGEVFTREVGSLPGDPNATPSGALYAVGQFNPELADVSIISDTVVQLVYRLDFPAATDVTVTLSVGDEDDVNAYNDAKGLKNVAYSSQFSTGYIHRYVLLPETNYVLPATLTLTVPQGKTESPPLAVGLIYDKALLTSSNGLQLVAPWMLPLKVASVEGSTIPAIAEQMLGIGVRPASMTGWNYWLTGGDAIPQFPKESPFQCIVFADCRTYDPAYAIYYIYCKYNIEIIDYGGGFKVSKFIEGTDSYYALFDIECLQPVFITQDAMTGMPILEVDPDLMFVLTHQERYVDPQRKLHMKICVSVETGFRSPLGLCNLGEEARASLVWQIKNLIETYGLDGVALSDKEANYASQDTPAADAASYTRFLAALRSALGPDKLILISYDADENSALYEAHDGLQAGDYIDYAWWGTENELCTLYDGASTVKPIAGLDKNKYCPVAGDCADTEEFDDLWTDSEKGHIFLRKLQDLYDEGQFPFGVYLGLRAYTHGPLEGVYYRVPEVLSDVPYHEGSQLEKRAGWMSGLVDMNIVRDKPGTGYYGGGLKDW